MLSALPFSLIMLLNSENAPAFHAVRYGDWISGKTQCSTWLPDASKAFADNIISQSRTCTTKMSRSVSKLGVDAHQKTIVTQVEHEDRLLERKEQRTVRGAIDEIVGIKKQREFSSWRPTTIHRCEQPPQLQQHIPAGQTFITVTHCQASLFREKLAVEVWRSGRKTVRGDLTETEHQEGTYFLVNTESGLRETWHNDGFVKTAAIRQRTECRPPHIHTRWDWGKPVVFMVACDEILEQSIKHQQRTLSGKKRVVKMDTTTERRPYIDSVIKWGSEDYVVSEKPSYTPWVWTPGASQKCFDEMARVARLLPWGTVFTEVAQCEITQERQKQLVRQYASGYTDVLSSASETRQSKETITRTAFGGEDRRLSTDSVSYGDWTEYSRWECSGWLPSETAVAQGTRYQQLEHCTSSRGRPVHLHETWLSGVQTISGDPQQEFRQRVVVRDRVGVKVVSLAQVQLQLNTPSLQYTTHVPAHAQRVRVFAKLPVSHAAGFALFIGDARLELPALASGNSTFYFQMTEFGVKTGNQSLRLESKQPPSEGLITVSFE